MPKLLFVTAEHFPVPNNIREDDLSHKKFVSFRDRVLAHRLVERFESPKELALMVVQAIHNEGRGHQVGPSLCQVYCIPSLVRAEGYTERLGDILITVYGKERPAQVDISLTLGANVTNRIDPESLTDAEIRSERQGVLGRGRLQGFNRLLFEGVELDQLNPEGDELLTIAGVRAAATDFATGANISGLLEITARSADKRILFRGPLIMALIPGTTIFSAARVSDDFVKPVDPALEGGRIRSFVVEFTGTHPLSFKTRDQETAGCGPADQGTVLILFAHIPKGFRLFATMTEIEFSGVRDDGLIGKAVLVNTDSAGAGAKPADAAAQILWRNRTEMAEVGEHVAWEVMSPLPVAKLRFGLAIVGPVEGAGAVLWVGGGLGPHYSSASAHQAQPKPFPYGVSLAVPRFSPLPVFAGPNLVLD